MEVQRDLTCMIQLVQVFTCEAFLEQMSIDCHYSLTNNSLNFWFSMPVGTLIEKAMAMLLQFMMKVIIWQSMQFPLRLP